MSKKKIILVGLGVLVAIGVIGGIRVIGGNKQLIEPDGDSLGKSEILEVEEAELVLYEDGSGFSFKVPANLVVEDKTEEAGEEYYTSLEIRKDKETPKQNKLASGQAPGQRGKEDRGIEGEKIITIAIRDTEYKTLEDWLEKDEEAPKGAKLAGAVALDDISAKQYSKDDQIWTVAIDLGALYLIEGTKSGNYWRDVYNRLVETFAFAEPEGEPEQKTAASSGSGASTGGDVIYEAEEVVE